MSGSCLKLRKICDNSDCIESNAFKTGKKHLTCHLKKTINDVKTLVNYVEIRRLNKDEYQYISELCKNIPNIDESTFVWLEGFYNKVQGIKGVGLENLFNGLLRVYGEGYRFIGLYPSGGIGLIKYYERIGFKIARDCIDPSLGIFIERSEHSEFVNQSKNKEKFGEYEYASPMFAKISTVLRKIAGFKD